MPLDITPPWTGTPETVAEALWRWCQQNGARYRLGDAIRELDAERRYMAEVTAAARALRDETSDDNG